MKLAFHGATSMKCNLEMDIAISRGAGFKALEVWAAKVDRHLDTCPLEDLKRSFLDQEVEPITLNSIEFIAFRGNEFKEIERRLHELGRIALAIGCPTVVVVPSPLPDRHMAWEEIRAEYVRVLRSLSSIAREYQLRLAFEFLGFGWCSVRTPRATQEILEAADRDNLGMVLDAAHFHCGGGSLDEIDRLDPSRVLAFHLDDLEDLPREAITDEARLLPGRGVVPLGEICGRLKGIGYDGPCSIELFRPEYWDWDPQSLAHAAREAALEVLRPHFRVEWNETKKLEGETWI